MVFGNMDIIVRASSYYLENNPVSDNVWMERKRKKSNNKSNSMMFCVGTFVCVCLCVYVCVYLYVGLIYARMLRDDLSCWLIQKCLQSDLSFGHLFCRICQGHDYSFAKACCKYFFTSPSPSSSSFFQSIIIW